MRLGLLGKTLSYSFSKAYFSKKFKSLGLTNYSYENFECSSVDHVAKLLDHPHQLDGLNVTIPYKRTVIQHLTSISNAARAVGAVNTIKFTPDGSIGYNTDVIGFELSLKHVLQNRPLPTEALILGTGGASDAVAFVLAEANIKYLKVSRTPNEQQLSYEALDAKGVLPELIVNTTPVGTFPAVKQRPEFPVDLLDDRNIVIDLIYNPTETEFLRCARQQGATTLNGLMMLEQQAEASWEIWTATEQL